MKISGINNHTPRTFGAKQPSNKRGQSPKNTEHKNEPSWQHIPYRQYGTYEFCKLPGTSRDAFANLPLPPAAPELPSVNDPIIKSRMELDIAERKKAKKPTFEQKAVKNSRAIDMEHIKSIILPPMNINELRSFENSDKKFVLDKYQKQAVDAWIEGNNSITTAPTGTGKTLIAEYAIEDALKKGKRIIYLSPLKALSNEKFTKFSELFGKYDENGNFLNSDNVGIITGDIAINPDARLLVMTTEIYRNMVNSQNEEETAEIFKDFDGVIFDEYHYLNDPDRGTVWEESTMFTPKHMKQMQLTATASNINEIADWIRKLSPEHDSVVINVPENERYVPLKEYVFGYDKKQGRNIITSVYSRKIDIAKAKTYTSDRVQEVVKELRELHDNQELEDILLDYSNKNNIINAETFADALSDRKGIKPEKALRMAYILSDPSQTKREDVRLSYADRTPYIPSLIGILDRENKTPALVFFFSKKKCFNNLVETANKLGSLLTPEQSKRVLDVVQEAKEKNIYLGEDFYDIYLPKLLMGYAVHHAGMLPAYKSLVEKLSREGLVKACFATETLLAGINMPFKTTVFTSIEKFDGRRQIEISPTTYKQGAGRAGRRGIDDMGNVIICPTSHGELTRYRSIMESDDTKIKSAFNPTYAALLQESALNHIDDFLTKSFFAHQAGSTQKIKKAAKQKINYLKEKGYIERNDEGIWKLTHKGEMAKNVYGINQILFCELIDDPYYTQNLSPEELAALMVMFADIKDDKPSKQFEDVYTAQKLNPALELAEEIQKEQPKQTGDEIKMSTTLVPAILAFAYMPVDNKQDCTLMWQEIFNDLKSRYVLKHEGDLLRVFNGTIDLLHTITKVSDNPELVKKAKDAINCLRKPPLTDILEYELNIK